MSRALGDLLESQEDRGVRAVTGALERLGVATWSTDQQCWIFHKATVSGETLHREVSRALGRAR